MFAQNKVKLLLVVLVLTALFKVEVNGAAVKKTIEAEKNGADIEHPSLEAEPKEVEKRNLKEDAENLRIQRFQQVLDEGAGGAAAHKGFFSVIMSAAVLSGLITYMRM